MALPPVLEAKLARPDPPSPPFLRRGAVDELAELIARHGTALISAPPGFGREHLIATWEVVHEPGATCWVRCDAGDNIVRLFVHVVEALRRVAPAIGIDAESLRRRGAEYVVEHGLAELITEVEALEQPVTLVLHEIDRLPADAREQVFVGARDRPSVGRMIATVADDAAVDGWPGRGLSPPPVLRRHALLLGADDVAALARVAGLEVRRDEVDQLERDTDGWFAPVALTISAAAESGRPLRFDVHEPSVDATLHRVICGRVDDDLRRVLLAIAPARAVDVSMARALTGERDVSVALRTIERRGLLELRAAEFRVPTLVREHLTADAERHDPDALSARRSAAAWAQARAGRVGDALEIIGRDPSAPGLLTLLFTRHQLWSNGAHAERVAELAAEVSKEAPDRIELYLVRAWAQSFSGDLRGAEATVSLLRDLDPPEGLGGLVSGECDAISCNIARLRGRMDDALALARSMAETVGRLPTEPPTPYRGSVPVGAPLVLGLALFCAGEIEESKQVLLAAAAESHWTSGALTVLHGTLALGAWVLDDPVSVIHGAIAGSHANERPNKGEILGPASFVLTHPDDADAARAALWCQDAAVDDDGPLSTVLARLTAAVVADGSPEVARALADARATVERCPQPGVLPLIVARAAAELGSDTSGPVLFDPLTEGERRVVLALAGELTEREIAKELHLSHNTVRTYRRRAYRKLGVTNRTDAVAALRRRSST